MLAAADLSVDSFTVDRIIGRNGSGLGLNCVWNLVLMPSRVNSYFGCEMTKEKEKYLGAQAVDVAKLVHQMVREHTEETYSFKERVIPAVQKLQHPLHVSRCF